MIVPSQEQAFIIGIIYGSSFEFEYRTERLEIWLRSEKLKKFLEKVFTENRIKYIIKIEGIRELLIVESMNEMKGFLLAFNIDTPIIKKFKPLWVTIGGLDIDKAFVIGILEVAGEYYEGRLHVNISSIDEDLSSYIFWTLYKQDSSITEKPPEKLLSLIGRGSVRYSDIHIPMRHALNLVNSCEVGIYSKFWKENQ